ncbi:hypothetical protein SAMN05428974_2316 [Sphingopyxis sp. YR583]|jgi:hypothetical protein|uniref:hypothetical protein n=1 Tax=Sphingopyxis sp. YR583 TaxID=1881047 RepID=UPI0008A7BE98|nr:hypothetical protein [Sphingopyxis sp. YR583]SEH17738.1 hypothetical protein SAMN05428974_2316 [Sphingopyxis sp. YR583]
MLHLSLRLTGALVLLGFAIPVAAKDKAPPPRPAQIQELYNCRDIADASARLACFDREVGELQAADTNREISFADKETVKKTRRGLFGFDLPDFGLFGGDDEEEKVKSVETTVTSASMTKDGGYRIAMADGSVWVQIDNKRMPLAPRPGQKIEIKTASFGTYFLSLEGRPSIRVRRER